MNNNYPSLIHKWKHNITSPSIPVCFIFSISSRDNFWLESKSWSPRLSLPCSVAVKINSIEVYYGEFIKNNCNQKNKYFGRMGLVLVQVFIIWYRDMKTLLKNSPLLQHRKDKEVVVILDIVEILLKMALNKAIQMPCMEGYF